MGSFELKFAGGPVNGQTRLLPIEPGQDSPAAYMEFIERMVGFVPCGSSMWVGLHRYRRVKFDQQDNCWLYGYAHRVIAAQDVRCH